jgi:hypothetical protein
MMKMIMIIAGIMLVGCSSGTITGPGELCGNGQLDSGEDCEGNDLGDINCLTLGYGAGVLACGDDCNFDTSGCGPADDWDDDGFVDPEDNCPRWWNPDQEDYDSDGVGDPCDNCLLVANPDQQDLDQNEVGDQCDVYYPVEDWTIESVDAADSDGRNPSIAVDSNAGVHIAFQNSTNGNLKYAHKPVGGAWSIETVDATERTGDSSSIDVDSAGNVYISYQGQGVGMANLKHAYKPSGGSWNVEVIDPTDYVGGHPSIELDSSGNQHISYFHNPTSDLCPDDNNAGTCGSMAYAYKPAGGEWSLSIIEQGISGEHNVGWYSSLGIDSQGGVHVSYQKMTYTQIGYAHKPAGGNWNIVDVDMTVNNKGGYTSLAVDPFDGVHISYQDRTNSNLKYAYQAAGRNLITMTVDGRGYPSVGFHSSLVSDHLGGVHVSYDDSSDGNLKYACRRATGAWQVLVVDSMGRVGGISAIAVDHLGGVHIAYEDSTSNDLKYAYQSNVVSE